MAIVNDLIPPFQLIQPSNLEEAAEAADAYGEEAWIIAGGMDSFDWLKDRTASAKRTAVSKSEP